MSCSCHSYLLYFSFFFNDPATTEIYTLSLHDALPIFGRGPRGWDERSVSWNGRGLVRRGSRRPATSGLAIPRAARHTSVLRSEEHTSELQSLAYLVCRLLLEKKNKKKSHT